MQGSQNVFIPKEMILFIIMKLDLGASILWQEDVVTLLEGYWDRSNDSRRQHLGSTTSVVLQKATAYNVTMANNSHYSCSRIGKIITFKV